MDTETAYEALIEAGVATEGELALVTTINGYSLETLEDVLYARTGYRDIMDYLSQPRAQPRPRPSRRRSDRWPVTRKRPRSSSPSASVA